MIKKTKNAMRELLLERGTRKYTFALVSLGALSAGMVFTAFFPILLPQYTTFAGSVIALYAAFVGGNVVTKWVDPKGLENTPVANKIETGKPESGE